MSASHGERRSRCTLVLAAVVESANGNLSEGFDFRIVCRMSFLVSF